MAKGVSNEIIKELRGSGFNQEEIAEKVGLERSTISRRLKKIKEDYQKKGSDDEKNTPVDQD